MTVTPAAPHRAHLAWLFVLVPLLMSTGPSLHAVGKPPGFAGVLVERGFLPDARPNAFAIGFSNGTSLCFDPVRGGVNYVWTGGFVDVAPIRPGMGKTVGAVTLLGDIVYRERSEVPWRVGSPERVPTVRFIGYTIGDDRIEFSYTIDQLAVSEEIRPRTGGGVERRITFSGDSAVVWYTPGSFDRTIDVEGARLEDGGYRVGEEGGRTMTVSIAAGRATR